jgi:hypothetical protein
MVMIRNRNDSYVGVTPQVQLPIGILASRLRQTCSMIYLEIYNDLKEQLGI